MLSSVLRSPRAVTANIAIMRAFVRYRATAALNEELAEKFRQLEGKVDSHDEDINGILRAMKILIAGPTRLKKRRIGFLP